jgi:DNA-binding NtrC family response regulator
VHHDNGQLTPSHSRSDDAVLTHAATLRVLIVDEDPLLRWALCETLGAAGMLVLQAARADAAVETLSSAPTGVDVVLLDCFLPDSRDFRLLGSLKKIAPETAVAVMSAFWNPDTVRDAWAAGADRVVSKPLEMHEVSDLLRRTVLDSDHRL